ncbi:hypothetical protein [Streptomyces sp. NRRL S-646]|uniref:oxidoreductase n=1 Tax=Streptomyces sp. NRRL S-646 TaxID=1463917 RepID=UPI001F416A5B
MEPDIRRRHPAAAPAGDGPSDTEPIHPGRGIVRAERRVLRQRSSHALLITEGTQPSADGQGYPVTPGIYTEEHIAGWRKVTDAVHAADGRIVIQLMRVGRISHPDNTPPTADSP